MMINYGADRLVAVFDLDPNIYEKIGEQFDYRVEIFQHRDDGSFFEKMWRRDYVGVSPPFTSALKADNLDVLICVQEHDHRWDAIRETCVEAALERVIQIVKADF